MLDGSAGRRRLCAVVLVLSPPARHTTSLYSGRNEGNSVEQSFRPPIAGAWSRVRDGIRADVLCSGNGEGWTALRFDPIRLANILGIATVARQDVPDARTVVARATIPHSNSIQCVAGAASFSIAHEIVHTFFPTAEMRSDTRGGPEDARTG